MVELDCDDDEDTRSSLEKIEEVVLNCTKTHDMMLLNTEKKHNFEFPLADILYIYDEEDWKESGVNAKMPDSLIYEEVEEFTVTSNANVAAKKETTNAYDKIGETAGNQGDVEKAKAILSYLGYTKE